MTEFNIPFNRPAVTGKELALINDSIQSSKISGDGEFSKKCEKWLENFLGCNRALLTSSCTHALEMAAILIDVKPGDEIIMPSYTFVSTANAFVMRGANVVFVDINPKTMNIDVNSIEKAITSKTRAIVPVHYAGVSCDMEKIMEIADRNNLYVIEDSAQGIMSRYQGQALGTFGHMGAYSFHETKNLTSGGEGGALIINDNDLVRRAEIIREKGTNRSEFYRGFVDKYSWVDIGSSYLMNEISAAYLWGNLIEAEEITRFRLEKWNRYFNELSEIKDKIELPFIPNECSHNAHMFFIKVKNIEVRTKLIKYLKRNKILAPFHYIPLHSSENGLKEGRFDGKDQYTTSESNKLIRLPLFYKISDTEIDWVVKVVKDFFHRL